MSFRIEFVQEFYNKSFLETILIQFLSKNNNNNNKN